LDKAISKYLHRYAHKDFFDGLETLLSYPRYGHVMVIPACAEDIALIDTLKSVPKTASPILIIVVINGRKDADDGTHERNQASYDAIRDHYESAQKGNVTTEAFKHPTGTLLVVDQFSKGQRFAAKEGVGLARKIGTDMALFLWSGGHIVSSYIHSSDADVIFPSDVFQQTIDASPTESHSALLLPFWHEPSPDTPSLRRANALYEIKLRYYVLGLRASQSPYAFHTIGSTIAVHAHDYARVRGFPKRQAGEDFYLLNKLAKLRPVATSKGMALRIKGRCSDRVPFGTGKSIGEIHKSPNQDYVLYAPATFSALHDLHISMDSLFCAPVPIRAQLAKHPSEELLICLEKLKLLDGIDENIRRGMNPAQRKKNFHTHFDGFWTMKLIHQLRDDFYPSLPFRKALSAATFIPDGVADIDDLDELRRALEQREQGHRREK
jgi:hypothetical protein